MILTCGGCIGVGKSSMTKILGDLLQVNQVYEPVEDNPLLEKFYEDKGTYGFVFQIDMLSKRFEMIEEALMSRNAILDRSIYEDSIFLHHFYNMLLQRFQVRIFHRRVACNLISADHKAVNRIILFIGGQNQFISSFKIPRMALDLPVKLLRHRVTFQKHQDIYHLLAGRKTTDNSQDRKIIPFRVRRHIADHKDRYGNQEK